MMTNLVDLDYFLSNPEFWPTVLAQLQSQMQTAVFDSYLKGTRIIAYEGDTLVIGVRSKFEKDWVENRLCDMVHKTVARLVDHHVPLTFEVMGPAVQIANPLTGDEPEVKAQNGTSSPDVGITLAQTTDFYREKEEADIRAGVVNTPAWPEKLPTNLYAPKLKMGRWLPEFQYDHRFWQAYLGSGLYSFLRYLWMYWLGILKKDDQYLFDLSKSVNQTWTTPFRLSYRDALRTLNKSNQKIIPGGEYECHNSYEYNKFFKRPLPECCQKDRVHQWRPCEGGGHCYFWRPGYLHKLYDLGLLVIKISDKNRAMIQVWRILPLLTPTQVLELDPVLQDDHREWIDNNGSYFNITLAQWEAITVPSLIPHQPTYTSFSLDGQPPANPFITSQH